MIEKICTFVNILLKIAKEKYIYFPKNELKKIKKELHDNKKIITTRVKDDFDKYHKNDIVKTEWGQLLIVTNVKTYDNILKHPYYDKLTKTQKKTIGNNDEYDVVYLSVN
jgi:hypothetical protein